MINNIDISVIIPVYNASLTINECLNSVISELITTCYRWEVIVINDGSNDNSLEKLYNYKELSEYKENILIINQSNQGAAIARNTGIKASHGYFIAFNDSDDRWVRYRLLKQLSFLEQYPEVDVVAGNFGEEKMRNSVFKKMKEVNEIRISDQVLKNYFSPPTVIFKRRILQKTGLFKENMRYFEEGYLFNRMVFFGKCYLLNFKASESITGKRNWGESGLSGNLKEMEKGELYNLREAYKCKYISLALFIFAYSYSLLKFLRRYIFTYYHKLFKCFDF